MITNVNKCYKTYVYVLKLRRQFSILYSSGSRVDYEEMALVFILLFAFVTRTDNSSFRENPGDLKKIFEVWPFACYFLPRLQSIINKANEIEAAARENRNEIVLDAQAIFVPAVRHAANMCPNYNQLIFLDKIYLIMRQL